MKGLNEMDEQTKQRGFKSYGDLTLNQVLTMAETVMGEWNGDESGRQEDRAHAAQELLEPLNKVLDIIIALEEEL